MSRLIESIQTRKEGGIFIVSHKSIRKKRTNAVTDDKHKFPLPHPPLHSPITGGNDETK